ncbi:phosphotransferase [Pasteuria penetrans]|uniref:phosphotransferase n=1 Tax=Pasteuria penetrans TaxID=86005 RepID=UPI00165CD7B7|nr:phosphotransferase [Pasteuria penetrans]
MQSAPCKAEFSHVQQVLQNYRCTPRYIQKSGNLYKIVADEGIYALKFTTIAKNRLLSIHSFLRRLRQDGYPHVLPTLSNSEGKSITPTPQGNWYLTPWKASISPEKNRPLSGAVLARSLAKMHRIASPLVKHYQDLAMYPDRAFLRGWNRQYQAWAADQSQSQPAGESPLRPLWDMYKTRVEQAFSFSTRGMEKFLSAERGMPPRKTLCHRRIHSSNIVQGETTFYWVDFDDCGLDSPVRDLALLLHRYSPDRSGGAVPQRLLAAYEEEWRLRSREKKLLAIYLAYPERIAKRYKRSRVISPSAAPQGTAGSSQQPLPTGDSKPVEVSYSMVGGASKGTLEKSLESIWKSELYYLDQLQSMVRSLWSSRSRLGRRG